MMNEFYPVNEKVLNVAKNSKSAKWLANQFHWSGKPTIYNL